MNYIFGYRLKIINLHLLELSIYRKNILSSRSAKYFHFPTFSFVLSKITREKFLNNKRLNALCVLCMIMCTNYFYYLLILLKQPPIPLTTVVIQFKVT